MGNCATGPKKSKSGEEAEAPIPPPEDAVVATDKKEEITTRDVDLTAVEPKVEPEAKGEVVSTPEVVGLAVVAAEAVAVVVEGGEEEIVEKVKEVVVDEESTAEDAAGSKRLSLSNLFNKEQEVKTPEESDKTSSEPTKEVESSQTELLSKESESESKVEAAEESAAVPNATPEPQLAVEVVVEDTPAVANEKVTEVAEESTEKQEKKPEEETKA